MSCWDILSKNVPTLMSGFVDSLFHDNASLLQQAAKASKELPRELQKKNISRNSDDNSSPVPVINYIKCNQFSSSRVLEKVMEVGSWTIDYK